MSSAVLFFQAAIKGLTMGGLEVISITDNTPVPHNGCRPRKARRMWEGSGKDPQLSTSVHGMGTGLNVTPMTLPGNTCWGKLEEERPSWALKAQVVEAGGKSRNLCALL